MVLLTHVRQVSHPAPEGEGEMRLHPEVSQEEAYEWLKEQVERDGPFEGRAEELEAALRSFAEAMAAISRVVLPDELEPLFP